MKLKKIITLLLALSLILSVLMLACSCNKDNDTDNNGNSNVPPTCTSHKDENGNKKCDICDQSFSPNCASCVDTNNNGKCDVCGKDYVIPATSVSCTVTILDEDGAPVSGAVITLGNDDGTIQFGTTGNDGKAKKEIDFGEYIIYIEELPEYWYISTNYSKITVSETSKDFSYVAIDNSPDGSLEKPFFLGSESDTRTFGAGVTYNYSCVPSTRYIVIENASAKLVYNDTEYLPDNGVIKVLMYSEEATHTRTILTVTNTSDAENSITVSFEELPGSLMNPYVAELDTETVVTVPKESSIHYVWTATATGTLKITSPETYNLLTLYNENTYVMEATGGRNYIEIDVNAGDVIKITVSSSNTADESSDVTFTLSLTEAE